VRYVVVFYWKVYQNTSKMLAQNLWDKKFKGVCYHMQGQDPHVAFGLAVPFVQPSAVFQQNLNYFV